MDALTRNNDGWTLERSSVSLILRNNSMKTFHAQLWFKPITFWMLIRCLTANFWAGEEKSFKTSNPVCLIQWLLSWSYIIEKQSFTYALMFRLNSSIIIRMKAKKCLNTTVYNSALLRVVVMESQRLVRIVPPFLSYVHNSPGARNFHSSISHISTPLRVWSRCTDSFTSSFCHLPWCSTIVSS